MQNLSLFGTGLEWCKVWNAAFQSYELQKAQGTTDPCTPKQCRWLPSCWSPSHPGWKWLQSSKAVEWNLWTTHMLRTRKERSLQQLMVLANWFDGQLRIYGGVNQKGHFQECLFPCLLQKTCSLSVLWKHSSWTSLWTPELGRWIQREAVSGSQVCAVISRACCCFSLDSASASMFNAETTDSVTSFSCGQNRKAQFLF